MSSDEWRTVEEAPSDTPAVPKKSLAIVAFSTVVEWYDFTLFLYLAPVLSRVFFGGHDNSVFATLGVFAAAYLMRPIGAIYFGQLGDRIGRRKVLLMSMTLMAIATFLTASLPTYATIGVTTAFLMFVLRCVMGFSVGGEYSGVLVMLLESSKREHRGFVASLAAAASEVGALLAAGVSTLVVMWLPRAALDDWGWRIPFLFGGALAVVTLLLRTTVSETPAFERARDTAELSNNPVSTVLKTQRHALLVTLAISALGSVTYYAGVAYIPTFLDAVADFEEDDALVLSTIAATVVIAITPLVGALSDRIGRRPMLVALAVMFIVVPLPMFGFMASGNNAEALLGAVILAAGAGAISAVAASAAPEQFVTIGRFSGLALGYTMATAAFGGLAPLAADLLISLSGWDISPGFLVLGVAVVTLPIIWRLPETANRELVDVSSPEDSAVKLRHG